MTANVGNVRRVPGSNDTLVGKIAEALGAAFVVYISGLLALPSICTDYVCFIEGLPL